MDNKTHLYLSFLIQLILIKYRENLIIFWHFKKKIVNANQSLKKYIFIQMFD